MMSTSFAAQTGRFGRCPVSVVPAGSARLGEAGELADVVRSHHRPTLSR